MNMQGLYSVEIFSTLFDVMNGAIKFQSIYLYFLSNVKRIVIYDYTNYEKIQELQKHDIITMELDNLNVKYDA